MPHWVPDWVRRAVCDRPVRQGWMAALVLHPGGGGCVTPTDSRASPLALGPTAIRQDRIRTYTGYVAGVLFDLCGADNDNLWDLRRDAVLATIVRRHPTTHTRRPHCRCHSHRWCSPPGSAAWRGTTS